MHSLAVDYDTGTVKHMYTVKSKVGVAHQKCAIAAMVAVPASITGGFCWILVDKW